MMLSTHPPHWRDGWGEMSEVVADEFDAISVMLTEAEKHGLLVEVVHQFGCFRAAGDDVPTAASAALYEWDI